MIKTVIERIINAVDFFKTPKESAGRLSHFQCAGCYAACVCRFAGQEDDAAFDKEFCSVHQFHAGCRDIWSTKCDIALPCATQNELDVEAAKKLIANKVILVGEGFKKPAIFAPMT